MANFTTFFTHTHPQTPFSLHSLKPFSFLLNYSPFHLPKSCIIPLSRFKRKPFNLICSTSHLNDGSNVTSSQISGTDIWSDCSYIEVIGIGSRVDSVLDFCLQSSSCPQSLRFWNVIRSESSRGLLSQRLLRQDSSNIVEAPLSNSRSHSKAVVLVASAGYGDDYVLATEILRSISSGSGMVAAIILKPFSFEGQRRQHEVDLLVDRLQDCVNFCIDIDIDTLLKMDLVTLDEALKNAYRAVSSAITAVSVLVSDSNRKYIHSLNGSMRQVSAAEIKNVLASYKEGRVGFGVGHNVEASILQAVYDCPFLSVGLKDLDGVVVCILSSSSAMEDSDMHTLLRAFREVTECTNEVILSVNHNHDMKPNLIASTVITVGHAEGKSLQKSSILSRLADSIPFVFNFLRGNKVMSDNSLESDLREKKIPSMSKYLDKNEVQEPDRDATENSEMFAGNDMLLEEDYDEKVSSNGGTESNGRLGATGNFVEPNSQGAQASGGKPLINRNAGPGYRMVQERQYDQLYYSEAISVADNPRAFQLPVGVRLSDDVHSTVDRTSPRRLAIRFAEGDATVSASAVPSVSSSNGLTDMGFEVVTDIWNNASTLLKGKDLDVPKKQGLLSARAASMLEVERDSKSRWSPVMKIEYRGGIYKGHCQGGLPEGRGRLTFQDGSVYDGMWRYGKRSGLGSLVFSNGDVFHGSWRDDLMHGKGWLYFHTGERWFANFWKGIPNGEGRFYSKSGEVLFGHFQDGWRDGRFLCVKVDGRRYVEIWNDGVLVSCEELDS